MAREREAILEHIQARGVRVGPGYWQLVREAERAGAPRGRRHDAAIVLAARGPGRAWLGSDAWAACYALRQGVRAIYVHPNL